MSHTVQTTHVSGTFDAPLLSRRPTEKDKILHCMEIAGGYMCQLEKVTAERDDAIALAEAYFRQAEGIKAECDALEAETANMGKQLLLQAREIERLKCVAEDHITEEKAREVLGDAITPEGHLYSLREYFHWTPTLTLAKYPNGEYAGRAAILDAAFTALQLKAIAWWMENKGEGDE